VASSILFNAALTGAFQATDAFAPGEDGARVTLLFDLTVSVAAKVEWYLELSDDASTWRREVAQEDQGAGVVDMPEVVRNFQKNGGGVLAAGSHGISVELVRQAPYARVQIRAASGTVTNATVTTPYGVLTTF
jgi:hypothetical protein